MATLTQNIAVTNTAYTDCGNGPMTLQAGSLDLLSLVLTDTGDSAPAVDESAALLFGGALYGRPNSVYILSGQKAWVKCAHSAASSVVTAPGA